MSHFIRSLRIVIPVTRPIAAVVVEVLAGGKELRVVADSGVSFLDASKSLSLVEIPSTCKVLNSEGATIRPSLGFWVTVETFDPYHLLVDADEEALRHGFVPDNDGRRGTTTASRGRP